MKNIILASVMMTSVLVLTACGNEDEQANASFSNESAQAAKGDEVPAAVIQALSARYPNAKDVEWEAEEEDNRMIYEAEFEWSDKDMEVEFDAVGNLLHEDDD